MHACVRKRVWERERERYHSVCLSWMCLPIRKHRDVISIKGWPYKWLDIMKKLPCMNDESKLYRWCLAKITHMDTGYGHASTKPYFSFYKQRLMKIQVSKELMNKAMFVHLPCPTWGPYTLSNSKSFFGLITGSTPVFTRMVKSSGNSTTDGPSSSNKGLARHSTLMLPIVIHPFSSY